MRYGVLLLSVVGLGADSVTFDLSQYRDVPNAAVLVFSGTISSRAGGEYVLPATPTGQVGFQGKLVALQRQAGSGWVRVRAARLVRKASFRWGAFNYQARFQIPTRGLTLRAYLPAKSAAPCFLPGSSPTWRS